MKCEILGPDMMLIVPTVWDNRRSARSYPTIPSDQDRFAVANGPAGSVANEPRCAESGSCGDCEGERSHLHLPTRTDCTAVEGLRSERSPLALGHTCTCPLKCLELPRRSAMVLWASGTLTPIAALAEITGWTRRRVKDTLDVLEDRLAVAGLVLNRLDSRVAIRGAGDVDGDVVAAAVRAHLNRDKMNITEMRLLRRILDGDTPAQPTNSEQVALGVLANARLIEPDGPGGWKATAEVEFSLGSRP